MYAVTRSPWDPEWDSDRYFWPVRPRVRELPGDNEETADARAGSNGQGERGDGGGGRPTADGIVNREHDPNAEEDSIVEVR